MLIGHKDYYPRFGYMPASKYGISFPFEVANENAMAIELVDSGLKGISGEISYPNEFSS